MVQGCAALRLSIPTEAAKPASGAVLQYQAPRAKRGLAVASEMGELGIKKINRRKMAVVVVAGSVDALPHER
jgi:hypothetical protein